MELQTIFVFQLPPPPSVLIQFLGWAFQCWVGYSDQARDQSESGSGSMMNMGKPLILDNWSPCHIRDYIVAVGRVGAAL